MKPLDFVREFISVYEGPGIYDEYDRNSNKMVTSKVVQGLYKMAKESMPPRLNQGEDQTEAARTMRDLDPALVDNLIKRDEEKRIIDLRATFAKRMAINGGAQGVLKGLLEAAEEGDIPRIQSLMLDAKGIIDGPEKV